MKLVLSTLALIFVILVVGSEAIIQLEHLSTLYLPFSYHPSPIYKYNKDVAEQSAYDPNKKILYTVGNDILHVIDMKYPRNPRIVYNSMLPDGDLTDIETCGDYVAVAWDNKVHPLEGKVFIYKGFDNMAYTMEKLHSLSVGALPDNLKFTSDCSKIVVALEGELRKVDDKVVDPEGGVAIITFCKDDPSRLAHVKLANFTKFNSRAEEYVARGVRWVYRGEGTGMKTTFSQDLEPEYVTFNCDETKAYIGLQENNAIATVDLVKGEIIDIYPLGSKAWEGLKMDISDKDGGINLKSWPVHGLYQPDAIKYVVVDDHEYIITANEGEEKEYEKPDFPFEFSDGQPGKYFVENDLLDDSVLNNIRDALVDESQMGRLRISTRDGLDPVSGKVKTLYTYGGRGFSVWDANTMSLVYDSGDEVERRIADHFPQVFSSNGKAEKEGPESSMDSRSRKKGPETETFDFGEVNGRNVLFVANERPGIILLYSFNQDMTGAMFESAHYAGGSGESWNTLYKQRLTRDIDPEDIRFIDASSSPNGKPMLVVSGSTSGTVSLYEVTNRKSVTFPELNDILQHNHRTNSTS